jgi:hypothetical protein
MRSTRPPLASRRAHSGLQRIILQVPPRAAQKKATNVGEPRRIPVSAVDK